MDSNEDDSRISLTGRFSNTAGIRESRKFFSLISRIEDVSPEKEDELLTGLEEFLKQTWNIYGVTVLFDFNSNDEVQLKQYAKKLREEVAGILSQEDVSYDAKINILELPRPKETDHPLVKIEVSAQVTNRDGEGKCIYKGYLLSWSTDSSYPPISESAKRLPILLCRGTSNTIRAVHQTLARMFDCILLQLPSNQEDLLWLLLITLSPGGGQDEARKADEVQLEYSVPGLPNSDVIAVKFRVQDLIDLWTKFLAEKDKIEVEDVKNFQKVLQRQILEITDVQLGLCVLHRITLPSISISENKMKITNVETMNSVLIYLNEKALDTLHVNITQLNISK